MHIKKNWGPVAIVATLVLLFVLTAWPMAAQTGGAQPTLSPFTMTPTETSTVTAIPATATATNTAVLQPIKSATPTPALPVPTIPTSEPSKVWVNLVMNRGDWSRPTSTATIPAPSKSPTPTPAFPNG